MPVCNKLLMLLMTEFLFCALTLVKNITVIITLYGKPDDRLCGLVVRVPAYRAKGPG
jgi:hypothetical protein